MPILLAVNHHLVSNYTSLLPRSAPNPFLSFILPSYHLPNGKYARGPKDWLFLGYYIVFWSFVRQAMTLHVIRPMGKRLGVRGQKLMRFTERE